jgi:molybdopterin-guanine dinucleotide biosynthesis protein A
LPRRAESQQLEPLFAWYDFRCLPLLESIAASDRPVLRRIADHPNTSVVSIPATLTNAWTDADTPEAASPFTSRRK